jgi:hypothetical protein
VAIDAFRWRDKKRLLLALFAIPPLIAAAIGSLWMGIHYLAYDFWGNRGFGPDWECRKLARASVNVCIRDLPQRLQDHSGDQSLAAQNSK